jgi:hypothetical protein
VHLLDAWAALPAPDFLRMAFPVALLVLAVLMPGRSAARFSALGVAFSLPFLRELGAPAGVTWGWVLLWLVIAWRAGSGRRGAPRAGARLGALESGTIGLLLGAALLALVVAGVARLDLESELTRRSSYGVLLVSLGFLHLMLRRHAARAAAAFAAMGLGLQVLQGVVRRVVTASGPPAPALPLLATALAVALALRVASVRESALGSSWVSDAHDLHD